MKKKFVLFLTVIGLVLFGIGKTNQVQASSYLNGNDYAKRATHYVKATKRVPVYRCHTGKYEAANHFYKAGYIAKGTKLHSSSNIMSTGGWIVTSKKYYHNSRTFFIVPTGQGHWYQRIK